MSPFGLDERTITAMLCILKKYPEIKRVSIFGSRATNTFKSHSDIDLVCFDDVNESVLSSILCDFDQSSIPYKIDFILYNKITHPLLKQNIDLTAKPFLR
ncbi:MAG: hypothetical protein A2007_05000 [Verrucomicrobia bacterium GWC2_42_7]|nr:MAG: hypothetical protein A2007_05000 [Verrucomicrobia bacterium GWC2_42_7]